MSDCDETEEEDLDDGCEDDAKDDSDDETDDDEDDECEEDEDDEDDECEEDDDEDEKVAVGLRVGTVCKLELKLGAAQTPGVAIAIKNSIMSNPNPTIRIFISIVS